MGLKSRRSLADIEIESLEQAFINLVSPANYFLLPKPWGGLGEAQEFIDGMSKGGAWQADR